MNYRLLLFLHLLFNAAMLLGIPAGAAASPAAWSTVACGCEDQVYDICRGDAIELSCATYADCNPYCTRWLPDLYLTTDSHQGDLTIRVAPEVSTTYSFYVTDEAGEIVDEVVFRVNVHEPFAAELTASNALICEGSSVELQVTPAGPNYSYDWADLAQGPETANRTVDAPMTYTVTVTNTATNCSAVDSITIAANEGPDAEAAMLDFFRSQGFLEFEITILEEEGLQAPGAGVSFKSGLVRNEFPRDITFDEHDNAPLNLESLLATALGGAGRDAFDRKGYITGNYSFCEAGASGTTQTVIEESGQILRIAS